MSRPTEEHALARLSLLARVGEILDLGLHRQETLTRVADLLVPGLATWCAFDVADLEGTLATRVAVPGGFPLAPDAPHANTAKLFLDFVLSDEGQAATSEGGLTSYRDSVKAAEGRHTYQEVVDAVGEDNVIIAPYELITEADVAAFTERWNGLLEG